MRNSFARVNGTAVFTAQREVANMQGILELIGRSGELFTDDLRKYDEDIRTLLDSSRTLVIGAAGTIGRAVSKELFRRNPRVLHVVDLNENSLTELVRDIRSSLGYISGEFKTFCLDCGALEFDAFIESQPPYDYILNFSALKHVRSERDPYTLMRMVAVNVLSGEKLLGFAAERNASKYFAVSTDKAAHSVNMMGASKRIMELFILRASRRVPVSMARFPNVAFSDGSLLDGFNYRMRKRQPITAPRDVRRYFVTEQESGVLCLIAAFVGRNRETLFPKLSSSLHMTTFSEIAEQYLESLGYVPYLCESEDEARSKMEELYTKKMWPCYFFDSDTSGEKEFEELYENGDQVTWDRFRDIGVILNSQDPDDEKLDRFLDTIMTFRNTRTWTKRDLVELFHSTLGQFAHKETFKYLDDRM
jgi:FlaA1/EpsC-like NDP-sugar epimerase